MWFLVYPIWEAQLGALEATGSFIPKAIFFASNYYGENHHVRRRATFPQLTRNWLLQSASFQEKLEK
jgi:hypothetical protein